MSDPFSYNFPYSQYTFTSSELRQRLLIQQGCTPCGPRLYGAGYAGVYGGCQAPYGAYGGCYPQGCCNALPYPALPQQYVTGPFIYQ